MRQLPAAPRISAPRNGSRQTIATDLRRVSEPLPAAPRTRPAPRCQTSAPPRLRTPAPPRAPLSNLCPAQRNPPNRRHGTSAASPNPRPAASPPQSANPSLRPSPPRHGPAPHHAPAAPPNASSQVETQVGPTAYYHTVDPSRVVPRAGARKLVTGGDYCVFICGHQVIEHQFVMPFVEVVKTIPGKCVSRWKRVLKMWSNCGQIWGIQETRLCKVIKNQQFTKSCRASGGNRTRTTLSGQGILSPSCLPFHHQGKAIAPQPLRQSHCAAASVSARWNADWSQIYKLIADVCKIILNY